MPRTSAVDRAQEVYATSYRRLVGQLTGVTGDPVEAEDAVVEAFARAVSSPRSFRAADNPEAWLRTVAVNVTRTRWRRSRFFRDVSEQLVRAEPPGFGAIVERARTARRRRRTTIGLAAVVVVVGLAFAVGGPGDRSADPSPPAPTTTTWDGTSAVDATLPSDVRAVLDDDRLDLWTAAGSSGAVAVLWRGCDQEPCRFALVTRDGDQVSGSALGASFPRLSAVPNGWLVEDATGTIRLSPSGDRAQIYVTGPGGDDVMEGDTAVETAAGWRLLRGDKVIALPSPSGRDTVGAYVTPTGRLIAATTSGFDVSVSTTDDGRTWEMSMPSSATEPATAAVVPGNGDHVAIASLGDAPDGSMPVVEVQLSHDAGATWTAARGLDTVGGDRVRDLSAVAVAPDGTTYVTTGSHHLVRIDPEGNALPIQLSSFDSSVFVVDDTVCVVSERGRIDQLSCSDDGGTAWAGRSLPGFG
ncbi:Sigma-70 region 2 [Nocardioides alpinus]|uniref:Sigma-70 region 2 n=1 Tax=Nocardioides alpinus TaxID=748909 RepID=A0A1I1ABU2_9ACTN|nr:sigma factor [Nocardioides alpinus]PKH43494.1 hypothetical protein CXG46_03275 [Nocardioides alpinus]SFB35461.1 Sigma-70 region 2 [Nocardioides alpinus]